MKQELHACFWEKGVLSFVFLTIVFVPLFYSGIFIEDQMVFFSTVFLVPIVIYQLVLKKRISLSFVDIALLVFIVYYIGRLFTSQGDQNLHLCKLLSLTCWYLSFRLIPFFIGIMYLLVICGVIQTFLVVLQSQFIIHGNHPFFHITGTFHNPAPLGVFLAISLIVALVIGKNYLQQKNKKGYIFIASSIFMAWGLYLSDSRAAWLAVFSCILLMILRNKWCCWNKKKRLLSFLGYGMSTILFSILLYQYKPSSADGRVFIWGRSLEMIKDKLLWGHGIDGFRRNYMLYQADYFEKNPQSHHSILADNVEYAYNEFIKIFVEMGFVGLILFFFLLFVLLKKYPRIGGLRGIYGGLYVLFLFSLFSYPSDVYICLVLFSFFAANLSQKVFWACDFPRRWSVVTLCIIPVCMFWGMCEMHNYYLVDTRVKKNNNPCGITCQNEFLCRYHRLKYHPRFMAWFARQAFQNKGDNVLLIIEDALLLYPCVEVYCDLGSLYQQQGQYIQAKKCYIVASNMVPSRIIPKYKLYKLYIHEKDFVNAKKIADQILDIPVKMRSSIFLKVKAEIMNRKIENN